MSMIDMASIAYGKRHEEPQDKQKKRKQLGRQETRKKTSKQKGKQKVVSTRDTCRFGLNVRNFIV